MDGVVAWQVPQPGLVPHFAASSNGDIILGPTFNQNWWSEELFISAYRPDGAISWRKKVTPYQWGFDQGLSSSPALDVQGNIITTAGAGQLVKLSPDAANTIWTFQGSGQTVNNVSPIATPDGSIRWAQNITFRTITPAGAQVLGVPSTVISIGVSPNGDMAGVHGKVDQSQIGPLVTYFNPDGTIRWTTRGLGGGNGTPPVFGPDGILYVAPKGTLIAYNPDGTVKWTDTAFSAGRGPALGANGQLYALGLNSVRAYNKDTGAVLWTTSLPGPSKENIAIDSRGELFVTTDNGYLVSIGSNGSVVWQNQICEKFTTGPIIGPGGLVVAAGKKGFEYFVFAIR